MRMLGLPGKKWKTFAIKYGELEGEGPKSVTRGDAGRNAARTGRESASYVWRPAMRRSTDARRPRADDLFRDGQVDEPCGHHQDVPEQSCRRPRQQGQGPQQHGLGSRPLADGI